MEETGDKNIKTVGKVRRDVQHLSGNATPISDCTKPNRRTVECNMTIHAVLTKTYHRTL